MSFQAAVKNASKPHKPKKPYAPGTLVTGFNARGLFGPIEHKKHLFITDKAKRQTPSNSGYVQSAYCIVCEVALPPVDSEFWEVKATREDIVICRKELTRIKSRLSRAIHRCNGLEASF